MGFIGILLALVDWVWCFVMPLIGTLHLVSRKYHKENMNKTSLFSHWCYYWILYVFLNIAIAFVTFFIGKLGGLLSLLRVAVLSVMVIPKLQLTKTVSEKIVDNSGNFAEIKEKYVNKLVGLITKEKPKES
eukprot:TRINITY_DN2540_c0_g1_i1.p1 TRINITY_DN2540_c0_g1~~TRINITY_DN2540_c0_g1_i1.p1  ORF type:complete len:131 (+),score=51.27 TRINITY_DN2540_c0_g1_i1:130-522(+)